MLPITVLLLLALPTAGAAAAPEPATARLEAMLAEMHEDYHRFIREVRPAGAAVANVHFGLVRPGGTDPRHPEDAPRPGHRRRYDLIVFGADPGPGDGEAWARLLLDHEYFHARHLAHAAGLPHPAFDSRRAQRHLYEAVAWGYSLERADDDAYGVLPGPRRDEVLDRYRRHRRAFRTYVTQREPRAWDYYGQFLPER